MKTPKPTKAEIRAVMAHLSTLGASKGGEARAKSLTAKRRREIAMMGVRARAAKKATDER